ncbi:MAG: MauE/DoxX family redox-associated membrane protein [bacterium]
MKRLWNLACHPAVLLVLRLALGAVFVYASLDKVQNPAAFARAVSFYHLAPESVINVFALLLPWAELVTGVALIAGVAARGSSLLIAAMLVMFLVALFWAIAKGIDISCGCFSTGAETSGEGHKVGYDLIVRDLMMLVATIPLIARGAGALAIDALFSRRARDTSARRETQ